MKSVKIYLENAAAAEAFVQTMRQFEGEYDLALGSYTVDAKSILGVFASGICKLQRRRPGCAECCGTLS